MIDPSSSVQPLTVAFKQHIYLALSSLLALSLPSVLAANPAITAFNQWCFKAGQTVADIERNMQSTIKEPVDFTLTFWDDSLEPRPVEAPTGIERRCEVAFDGNHTDAAITAMRAQMQTPPVFGTKIPLPDTHMPTPGTALIEGRELLRGRVAVVHVGTRQSDDTLVTFMAVDRLYDGLGLPKSEG